MDSKNKKENCAKAYGSGLPISTKQSIEICSYIRGKNLDKAIKMLQRVLEMKDAVPYTRFNNDIGHKPGIGPGRYPQKSTKDILGLLESVKANALAKGLNTDNLEIVKLIANKASRPWRYGRHRRRKAKRSHVEVVVEEIERKPSKKKTTKPAEKQPEKKVEAKVEVAEVKSESKEIKAEPVKETEPVKEETKVEEKTNEAKKE
ncbi:MAG: 50S ribosomal protein L22 [Nanoarchaeota archaeon]|nr:50S ribosomal protein L22 [Nanoarchaeota archaeon]